MPQIRLKVVIDENVTSQLSAVKNSERNYCKLLLTPFWKDEWRNQSERPIDDEILQSITDIFGDTVRNVKLIRLSIKINTSGQFLTSLKSFKKLTLLRISVSC